MLINGFGEDILCFEVKWRLLFPCITFLYEHLLCKCNFSNLSVCFIEGFFFLTLVIGHTFLLLPTSINFQGMMDIVEAVGRLILLPPSFRSPFSRPKLYLVLKNGILKVSTEYKRISRTLLSGYQNTNIYLPCTISETSLKVTVPYQLFFVAKPHTTAPIMCMQLNIQADFRDLRPLGSLL